ncbi:MAG: hypothetical protein U9R00_00490 [Patescibacteria group bacterium]|nr:hypothetical protein [Patescibacteria group bacterium]
MSITNFLNKIKREDKLIIFNIVILIIVTITAFYLGKFSVQENKVLIINQKNEKIEIEKKYLASKNGKMYYTIGCSAANRILEKNIIYFSSNEEAELAGYQFSTSCQ